MQLYHIKTQSRHDMARYFLALPRRRVWTFRKLWMVDDDRYHRPESPQFSLYWIATTDRYISFLGLRQYSRAPQQQTGRKAMALSRLQRY